MVTTATKNLKENFLCGIYMLLFLSEKNGVVCHGTFELESMLPKNNSPNPFAVHLLGEII